MKERGILFSAPMVRALLDDAKVQTRRAVKPAPADICLEATWNAQKAHPDMPLPEFRFLNEAGRAYAMLCPYGKPGDRLWVRETWMDLKGTGIEASTGSEARCAYRADTPPGSYGDQVRKDYGLKWTPAIHMFRWASRITLEITDVRVERLQSISRGDAMDEGCPFPNRAKGRPDPREWYADLWNQINGTGSWKANPLVWAVRFKRIEP